MASRVFGSRPPTSSDTIAAVSCSTMARRNSRCVSANCGKTDLQGLVPLRKNVRHNLICSCGLRHKRGEFRNIVVPFDQSRSQSDPLYSIGVEIPCGLRDRGRMRIDENDLLRLILFRCETAQVKLSDRTCGQLI